MANVTAQFPNGVQNPHVLADPATVLDLKNAVVADNNSPAGFFGALPAALDVSTGGGAPLADGTALVNLTVYDLALIQADGNDDGYDSGYDADDEGEDDSDDDGYDSGYEADDEREDDNGANGHGNGVVADGYVVYVYVNSAAGTSGPQEYNLDANSTVTALKDKIVADAGSPLAGVAAASVAVYDGSAWLSDGDPLTGNAAYTVQQVSAPA